MKDLLSDIVVLINGSESSIQAAKYGIILNRKFGTRVVAVYVVDLASIKSLAASRIFMPDESESFERNLEDTGKRYLSFVKELAEQKKAVVETRLLKGSVVSELTRVVEEIEADCIVIGGWEKDSQFGDIVLDTNRSIVKEADCPVVVVKGEMTENAFRKL